MGFPKLFIFGAQATHANTHKACVILDYGLFLGKHQHMATYVVMVYSDQSCQGG